MKIPRRHLLQRGHLIIAWLLSGAVFITAGCAGTGSSRSDWRPADSAQASSEQPEDRTTTGQSAADVGALARAAVTRQPWTFKQASGLEIETASHTIRTTMPGGRLVDDLPEFLEAAFRHYRTAITPLPAIDERFETYLFATREEWQDYTRDLMNDRAALYLNLGRGGYSVKGTAVVFDIGYSDTLSILAHEGWHQYTQRAFSDPLPTWLEEGIATYMEGRRRSGGDTVFDPGSNRQRRAMLARAHRRNTLIDLADLVQRSPQEFLARGADDPERQLLIYYAQVWGLVHFLMEGEGGKYRASLIDLLGDAVAGRVRSTILTSNNIHSAAQRRSLAQHNYGLGVVLAYFNPSLATIEDEYHAYLERVFDSRPRSRSRTRRR